jgi:hypothetical protein
MTKLIFANRQQMDNCVCKAWIQSQPIPGKVIILKCSKCETEYMLYPNGQIAYETR